LPAGTNAPKGGREGERKSKREREKRRKREGWPQGGSGPRALLAVRDHSQIRI